MEQKKETKKDFYKPPYFVYISITILFIIFAWGVGFPIYDFLKEPLSGLIKSLIPLSIIIIIDLIIRKMRRP